MKAQQRKTDKDNIIYGGYAMMYNLIDTHTGKIIKTYKSRKAAREAAQRLDWEYGAARYVVMIAR